MDNSLGNRIEVIKKESRLTIEEFVALLEVSKQSYSSWINGTYPNSEVLVKILKKFPEYKAEWLLLGEGEMKKGSDKVETVTEPQVNYANRGIIRDEIRLYFKEITSKLEKM